MNVQHFSELRTAAAVGGVVSGCGYAVSKGAVLLGGIAVDSVVPGLIVAGGIATAVVWLWRAPMDASVKALIASHKNQIKAYEERLKASEDARDQERIHWEERIEAEREKLRICRDALMEAGHRVKALELDSGSHPALPPSVRGLSLDQGEGGPDPEDG